MSHIHIPDGVLPLWLVAVGWLLASALIALAVRRTSSAEVRRRVPLVGAVGALVLVSMSSEIVPIAYHINLTVIAGILLGPWLSVVTAIVVVSVLALIGHGGVTVVGLNTLVIAGEMMMGWALFQGSVRLLGRARPGWSAGIATVIALAVSTTLLVGIVALGGSPAADRESGALDPQTLTFSNPFSEGFFANAIVSAEEEESPESGSELSITRFATMVYTLGFLGWLIEAGVTAGIVRFIARVRPRLVFEGAPAEYSHRPLGDEGVHH